MEKKTFHASKCYMVMVFLVTLTVGMLWAPSAWTCVPPPPPPLECRVTGGGVDTFGNLNGVMAYGQCKNENGGLDRYTFGGQAGAPTASQPQPYGEWTHHQQGGPRGSFIFHAGTASAPEGTEIDWVECADPGGCAPSGDPPSPCKRIYFRGVGTFKNIKNASPALAGVMSSNLYSFEVYIADLGEPGKSGKQNPSNNCDDLGFEGLSGAADCGCADFYRITIFSDGYGSSPIYEVYGYIKGGNLQIHYPVK